MHDVASQTLNQYRLLGHLARGGMADVFLACADGIGGFARLLVIKQILPELAGDTDLVRMFLDEARTAATLHHGNIVQVHDVALANGQVFYAMEYLHGKDVASALARLAERGQRIPLDAAIAITASVAAGLHYAHERRDDHGQPLAIVHRDVAPSNVLITYDGNVKLIDFGIAKAANNLSRTKFGLFKGKLPYASPEQCRCEPVDRRSDVFSLGALLYELTSGHKLFAANNDYELLRMVSDAVIVPPRQRDPAYSAELEAIVMKALIPDREHRYPTAQALQNDLMMFAQRRQLDLSAMSLSRLMERLFLAELSAWQAAQGAGVSLAEHVITMTSKRQQFAVAPADTDDVSTNDAIRAVRSPARRYAVRMAAAAGLLAAGATGALWLLTPATPRSSRPLGPAPVAATVTEPSPPPRTPAAAALPPPPSPPALLAADAASAAEVPAATTAASPRPASPARPATMSTRPKRLRASAAARRPLGSAGPAPTDPAFDDATLDNVVPRAPGSR